MSHTSSLSTFAQAKSLVLQAITEITEITLATESVSLFNAVNRIVAKPIISPINVPSFDNSAMDGYGVRLQDLTELNTLPIACSIFAGDDITQITWPAKSCVRIMTGAPIPAGCDAVIMQEDIIMRDDKSIEFNTADIKSGQNIRRIGESIKQHAILFDKGEKLTIPRLSSLATLGLSEITVFKPLNVAIFSTGNELCSIGTPLVAGGIYDSNRFTIHLMLKALGCNVLDLGIIKDDPELISQTLTYASQHADLIITSGGVSVGDADYTKQCLETIGQVDFWKIAMKPGKPFAFGRIGKALFCGLPGNPVSTLVTFYQLVRPLILGLCGNQVSVITSPLQVKTVSNLKKSPGRMDFQRGYLSVNAQGELEVKSTGPQGSHVTTSFDHANCFIVLERERGNVSIGEHVTIELFDHCLN